MQNFRALGALPPDPPNSPPISNFWLRSWVLGRVELTLRRAFDTFGFEEMEPRNLKIFDPFFCQNKIQIPKKGSRSKHGAPLALCHTVNLALVMNFIFY